MSLTVAGRRKGGARTLSGDFYRQVRRGGGTEEGTKGLTNHTEVALRRMARALGLELGLDHVEGTSGDAGDEAAPLRQLECSSRGRCEDSARRRTRPLWTDRSCCLRFSKASLLSVGAASNAASVDEEASRAVRSSVRQEEEVVGDGMASSSRSPAHESSRRVGYRARLSKMSSQSPKIRSAPGSPGAALNHHSIFYPLASVHPYFIGIRKAPICSVCKACCARGLQEHRVQTVRCARGLLRTTALLTCLITPLY